MDIPKRLNRLGTGVFERNDLRKQAYHFASINGCLPPLCDLSLGSTDILPPSIILEAIAGGIKAPESSSYCLQAATRPFREAVAAWSERRFGVVVDPDKEVLLLVGSQEGTAHLPLAVLDPGQVGLILDPSYPSHRGGLVLADAHIEKLLLKFDQNWKPDFGSLSISQLEQLRLMVFGFPHNPTATVGEQSWLDEAMQLGLRHNIVIAHDNPYVDLALEGDSPVLLRCSGWREWGIEFFSFSKAWCMGGFRIAFAIGSESVISALRTVKGVVDFNQSLALQRGAITALTDFEDWPRKILGVYRERRDTTISALNNLGWEVPIPSMAMYVWMPMPSWSLEQGHSDEELASEILNQTGVAFTPGSGFGSGGSGWLRMALVLPVNELEEGITRMRSWWDANS